MASELNRSFFYTERDWIILREILDHAHTFCPSGSLNFGQILTAYDTVLQTHGIAMEKDKKLYHMLLQMRIEIDARGIDWYTSLEKQYHQWQTSSPCTSPPHWQMTPLNLAAPSPIEIPPVIDHWDSEAVQILSTKEQPKPQNLIAWWDQYQIQCKNPKQKLLEQRIQFHVFDAWQNLVRERKRERHEASLELKAHERWIFGMKYRAFYTWCEYILNEKRLQYHLNAQYELRVKSTYYGIWEQAITSHQRQRRHLSQALLHWEANTLYRTWHTWIAWTTIRKQQLMGLIIALEKGTPRMMWWLRSMRWWMYTSFPMARLALTVHFFGTMHPMALHPTFQTLPTRLGYTSQLSLEKFHEFLATECNRTYCISVLHHWRQRARKYAYERHFCTQARLLILWRRLRRRFVQHRSDRYKHLQALDMWYGKTITTTFLHWRTHARRQHGWRIQFQQIRHVVAIRLNRHAFKKWHGLLTLRSHVGECGKTIRQRRVYWRFYTGFHHWKQHQQFRVLLRAQKVQCDQRYWHALCSMVWARWRQTFLIRRKTAGLLQGALAQWQHGSQRLTFLAWRRYVQGKRAVRNVGTSVEQLHASTGRQTVFYHWQRVQTTVQLRRLRETFVHWQIYRHHRQTAWYLAQKTCMEHCRRHWIHWRRLRARHQQFRHWYPTMISHQCWVIWRNHTLAMKTLRIRCKEWESQHPIPLVHVHTFFGRWKEAYDARQGHARALAHALSHWRQQSVVLTFKAWRAHAQQQNRLQLQQLQWSQLQRTHYLTAYFSQWRILWRSYHATTTFRVSHAKHQSHRMLLAWHGFATRAFQWDAWVAMWAVTRHRRLVRRVLVAWQKGQQRRAAIRARHRQRFIAWLMPEAVYALQIWRQRAKQWKTRRLAWEAFETKKCQRLKAVAFDTWETSVVASQWYHHQSQRAWQHIQRVRLLKHWMQWLAYAAECERRREILRRVAVRGAFVWWRLVMHVAACKPVLRAWQTWACERVKYREMHQLACMHSRHVIMSDTWEHWQWMRRRHALERHQRRRLQCAMLGRWIQHYRDTVSRRALDGWICVCLKRPQQMRWMISQREQRVRGEVLQQWQFAFKATTFHVTFERLAIARCRQRCFWAWQGYTRHVLAVNFRGNVLQREKAKRTVRHVWQPWRKGAVGRYHLRQRVRHRQLRGHLGAWHHHVRQTVMLQDQQEAWMQVHRVERMGMIWDLWRDAFARQQSRTQAVIYDEQRIRQKAWEIWRLAAMMCQQVEQIETRAEAFYGSHGMVRRWQAWRDFVWVRRDEMGKVERLWAKVGQRLVRERFEYWMQEAFTRQEHRRQMDVATTWATDRCMRPVWSAWYAVVEQRRDLRRSHDVVMARMHGRIVGAMWDHWIALTRQQCLAREQRQWQKACACHQKREMRKRFIEWRYGAHLQHSGTMCAEQHVRCVMQRSFRHWYHRYEISHVMSLKVIQLQKQWVYRRMMRQLQHWRNACAMQQAYRFEQRRDRLLHEKCERWRDERHFLHLTQCFTAWQRFVTQARKAHALRRRVALGSMIRKWKQWCQTFHYHQAHFILVKRHEEYLMQHWFKKWEKKYQKCRWLESVATHGKAKRTLDVVRHCFKILRYDWPQFQEHLRANLIVWEEMQYRKWWGQWSEAYATRKLYERSAIMQADKFWRQNVVPRLMRQIFVPWRSYAAEAKHELLQRVILQWQEKTWQQSQSRRLEDACDMVSQLSCLTRHFLKWRQWAHVQSLARHRPHLHNLLDDTEQVAWMNDFALQSLRFQSLRVAMFDQVAKPSYITRVVQEEEEEEEEVGSPVHRVLEEAFIKVADF